jgi:two-component system torCAD operon response regulator TorR
MTQTPATAPAAHILIIEDDPVTRTTLTGYLQTHGYLVTATGTADAAERVLADSQVDLLLVDVRLEGKDGLQITREQRARSDVGIILITGLSDDVDRIVGLELGADDYVCKPFNRRELLARIKNLLRRTRNLTARGTNQYRFAGFTFDSLTRQLAHPQKGDLRLTRAEYELLNTFVQHPAQVLSRDRLMQAVTHRQEHPDSRTVDVIVRRLRAKIEDDPKAPRLLTTSHGEGYVFTGQLE